MLLLTARRKQKAHSVIWVSLLAFAAEAHTELKIWPVHQTDKDNTTLAVFAKSGYHPVPFVNRDTSGFQIPRQQSGDSFAFQHLTPLRNPSANIQVPHGSRYTASFAMPKTVADAAEGAVDWPMLNIYDQPLSSCSPNHGDYYCTYNSDSPGICVAELPGTNSVGRFVRGLVNKPSKGAKNDVRWSKAEGFQCMSIWESFPQSEPEYPSDHVIDLHLRLGLPVPTWPSAASSSLDTNPFSSEDHIIKCNALPAEVLQSQFSLKRWGQCDLGNSLLDGDEEAMEAQCERFHQAIQHICDTCANQASDSVAKDALQYKCGSMSTMLVARTSTENTSIASVALVGLLLSLVAFFACVGAVWFQQLCFRDSALIAAEECASPLL